MALVIVETAACRGEDDLLSLSCWTDWDTFSTAKTQGGRVGEEKRFSSIYQGWPAYTELLP